MRRTLVLWRARLSLVLYALLRFRPIAGAEDPPAPPAPPAPAVPPAPPAPDPAKSFTEDEVNRIVQDRLNRDRKDRPTEDELKELREKAKRVDDLDEANKTELQKEKDRAEKAEKDAAAARERANETLIRSALLLEATTAKVANAQDAVDLALLRHRDKVTVGDDGQVTGADQAIKDLIKASPNLVGEATPPPPGDGGARPLQGDPAKLNDPKKVRDWAKAL